MPIEAKKVEKDCPKCRKPLTHSEYPKNTPEANMWQCKSCGRLYPK